MGKLLDDGYSKVTATLERLEQFDVTAEGLKRIRTMSPALLSQLAHIIEHGLSDRSETLPGLQTFDLTLDSRDTDSMKERMSQSKIFVSHFVDDILQENYKLPSEKRKFIVLSISDFSDYELTRENEKLSSRNWLKNWSRRNLLGAYYLAPCSRSDTVIHLALMMDFVPSLSRPQLNIIYGNERKDWIGIDNERRFNNRGAALIDTKIDFSCGWPAIFELYPI